MKREPEPDLTTQRPAQRPPQPNASRSRESEELPIGSADIEDAVQLERREAYTERPTQKLLRFLLVNEKDITPVYNPAEGFTYENIASIIGDTQASHQKTAEFLERLARLDILKKVSLMELQLVQIVGQQS